MKLTIGYLTSRWDCRFEWFAAGLARELRENRLVETPQVVVVDSKLWTGKADERRDDLRRIVDDRFEFLHVPPKPTVWQGPYRRTSRDFFCAANARNTVFAYATGDHVIFLDDLSVIMPGWLAAHLHAAEGGHVLCGMTSKRSQMQVDEDGLLVSWTFPASEDSRLKRIETDQVQDCDPGWLYGGTFSVPLAAALAVNGQDEICDGIGGEDYDFGARVARAGWSVKIDRTCGTIEAEDLHTAEPPLIRLDKRMGDTHSSNVLLNRLKREPGRVWTLATHFDLAEARARVGRGEQFDVAGPTHHWVDGQPLEEM